VPIAHETNKKAIVPALIRRADGATLKKITGSAYLWRTDCLYTVETIERGLRRRFAIGA
jgi:hypothetical protein